jgi:hypothetical protein
VEQDIGAVVAQRAAAPEPVVEDVGPVLDRAVVGGKRIEEEVVPEDFEAEDGAAEKGVFANEIEIVPDEVAVQRRSVNEKAGQQTKQAADERPGQPATGFFNPGRERWGRHEG